MPKSKGLIRSYLSAEECSGSDGVTGAGTAPEKKITATTWNDGRANKTNREAVGGQGSSSKVQIRYTCKELK